MLLFLSIFISGAQHALFSLTPSEVEELEKKTPTTFRHIQHLIARPKRLLVLVEILQTIISVTILFMSVKIGIHLFAGTAFSWVKYLFQAVILVMILLTFQEIIPKFFGGANNILWAKYMATPLFLLGNLFFPITEFLIKASHFVEKRFTRRKDEDEDSVMEKPEEQMVEESVGTQDTPILKGILKFGMISVRQIMRSRIDMVCIDDKTTFEQLLHIVREVGYSRLPVFQETVDNIKGVLYTKDLLAFLHAAKDQLWQQLIRTAYFVPEGKKISELLSELQRKQIHLAIVVDEYGRTAGLVTLEDIIEEITGDIRDETDERVELDYTQIDDNNFIFEGKTPINDFCKLVHVPQEYFDDVKSDSDSLGGMLLEIKGTIPQPNEVIEYENFVFTVLSLENYRIRKVKVTRVKKDEEAQAE